MSYDLIIIAPSSDAEHLSAGAWHSGIRYANARRVSSSNPDHDGLDLVCVSIPTRSRRRMTRVLPASRTGWRILTMGEDAAADFDDLAIA